MFLEEAARTVPHGCSRLIPTLASLVAAATEKDPNLMVYIPSILAGVIIRRTANVARRCGSVKEVLMLHSARMILSRCQSFCERRLFSQIRLPIEEVIALKVGLQ